MKRLISRLIFISVISVIPAVANADVRVSDDLDIKQGAGIKFYDGTLYSSKGITGPVGLQGADGTSVTSVTLPVGDGNCANGGVQLSSASGVNYVCNGADAGEPLKYGKVAVVAQSGGQYTSPIAALSNLYSWCGVPTSNNLCQVHIMPGIFDLGGTSLQLSPYVHLRGSGITTTILKGSINSATAGVVNGFSNVLVSDLSIVNTGGVTAQGAAFSNAIAMFNNNAAPELQNVSLKASGATNTYAIYNTASAPMTAVMKIRDSALTSGTAAIFNGVNTSTTVHTTRFDSAGGVENQGSIVCTANFIASQMTSAGILQNLDFISSGCPGSGFNFSIVSVTPVWQPSVMNGTITSSSTFIPTNTLISATFNQDMNPSTITPTSFYMKSSSGDAVAGTIAYDASSRTASFTPSSLLLPNTTFYVTITNAVRDVRGGKLSSYGTTMVRSTLLPTVGSSEYTWQFQTSAVAETTPMIPGYFFPYNGQVVGLTQAYPNGPFMTLNSSAPLVIAAEFPRQIDPLSISSSTIVLKDGTGATVAGQPMLSNINYSYGYATINSSQSTIQFFPSSQLAYGTTYTATIFGVRDIAGNAMQSPVSWTFSTIGGVAPTGVSAVRSGSNIGVSWQPVQGATGYNLYKCSALVSSGSETINCNYGEGIYLGTTTGTTVTSTTISLPVKFQNVTSPYSDAGPFAENYLYVYYVKAVFAGKEGVSSNQAQLYYDSAVPTVISHGDLEVEFSEAIDTSTLNNNFTVLDESGKTVEGYVSSGYSYYPGPYRYTATFYPTTSLVGGAIYTVKLAAGIKDMGGNALAPKTWSFTKPLTLNAINSERTITLQWQPVAGATSYTIYWSPSYFVSVNNAFKISVSGTSYSHQNLPDGSYSYIVTYTKNSIESSPSNQVFSQINLKPFEVIASYPANNAVDVSTGVSIELKLSTYINESTCNQSNVTLKDYQNIVVPVHIGCNNSSIAPSLWIWSPAALKTSTNYMLSVSGVKSQDGKDLTSPFSLSFKTTQLLLPPNNVSAAAGIGSATIMWNPVNGAKAYNIYWSLSPSLSPANGTKISNVTPPYVHNGLVAGTTYYYVVTAEDSASLESGSSIVSTRVKPYDETPSLASLQITPSSPVLIVGSKAMLNLTALYSDNSVSNVGGISEWVSSNPAIAVIGNTLPNKGEVTAVAAGSCIISASYNGLLITTTVVVVL